MAEGLCGVADAGVDDPVEGACVVIVELAFDGDALTGHVDLLADRHCLSKDLWDGGGLVVVGLFAVVVCDGGTGLGLEAHEGHRHDCVFIGCSDLWRGTVSSASRPSCLFTGWVTVTWTMLSEKRDLTVEWCQRRSRMQQIGRRLAGDWQKAVAGDVLLSGVASRSIALAGKHCLGGGVDSVRVTWDFSY